MSLTGLLGALQHDTAARIAAELAAAEAEAATIREESGQRLARRRDQAMRESNEALESERQRELALTTRRVRSEVMEGREQAIARILARLRHLVTTGEAEPMSPALRQQLISSALDYVPGEPATIRGAPPELAAADGAHHRLIADPAVGAGVIVATEDGRVTVDASLAGWLTAREPEVRMLIVGLLEQPE